MITQKSFERDRRCQLACTDELLTDFVNAAVNVFGKMFGFEKIRDAIIGIIIDQQCAKQCLFGLDIMRGCANRCFGYG